MKVFFNDQESIIFVTQIDELTESSFGEVVGKLIQKAYWLDEDEFVGLKLESGVVEEEFDMWYELSFVQLRLCGNFIISKDNVTKGQLNRDWIERFEQGTTI